MIPLETNNHELRTTREVARELNSIIDLISDKAVEKIVVTRSGKMVAVIITPERYDEINS